MWQKRGGRTVTSFITIQIFGAIDIVLLCKKCLNTEFIAILYVKFNYTELIGLNSHDNLESLQSESLQGISWSNSIFKEF